MSHDIYFQSNSTAITMGDDDGFCCERNKRKCWIPLKHHSGLWNVHNLPFVTYCYRKHNSSLKEPHVHRKSWIMHSSCYDRTILFRNCKIPEPIYRCFLHSTGKTFNLLTCFFISLFCKLLTSFLKVWDTIQHKMKSYSLEKIPLICLFQLNNNCHCWVF